MMPTRVQHNSKLNNSKNSKTQKFSLALLLSLLAMQAALFPERTRLRGRIRLHRCYLRGALFREALVRRGELDASVVVPEFDTQSPILEANASVPNRPCYGIQAARALLSGPEGSPEQESGPLEAGGRTGCCEPGGLWPCCDACPAHTRHRCCRSVGVPGQ